MKIKFIVKQVHENILYRLKISGRGGGRDFAFCNLHLFRNRARNRRQLNKSRGVWWKACAIYKSKCYYAKYAKGANIIAKTRREGAARLRTNNK